MLRHPLLGWLALSSLVMATLAGEAQAQDEVVRPGLDLRGFSPPTDPRSGLVYEPAASPDTGDWNIAMWNNYAYRPVTLQDPATEEVAHEVIRHHFGGDVVFNVGFFERVALGLDLPFVLYQKGDDPTPASRAAVGHDALPGQAIGDVKITGKFTIVKPTNQEFGGFALALHERFGMPSGDDASYLGEGVVTSETRLLAEYRYLAVSVHGAAGVKLRGEEEPYGCGAVAANCPTTFGHELPWSLSLVFRPQAIGLDASGNASWFIESFGYLPLSPEAPFSNAALSQVQIGGGARVAFLNDLSFIAAVDAALVGGVGTPPIRGHLAIAWAPRKHDMDGDGIRDEIDVCPEDLKEDLDGFEDDDGCPEFDNDDDGVLDADDQCPGEREDEDGYRDDDGCIDPDNDGDKILDDDDACPDVAGVPSPDPKLRGCPDTDADKDGVRGDADRCPDAAEDADGFEDDDGCPELDNDGDGFPDDRDACRDQPGRAYPATPELDGCPDADDDLVADSKDACPDQKGAASDDPAKNGCPTP